MNVLKNVFLWRFTGFVAAALAAMALGCSNPAGGSTPDPIPDAVSNLSGAPSGASAITLTWTAAADATAYDIYWSADGIEPTGAPKLSVESSPATATGLVPGATYTFWVLSKNGTGPSDAASVSIAFTLPTDPTTTALAAAASSTEIQLSWSYEASPGTALAAGFHVYRSTDPTAPLSGTTPLYTLTAGGTDVDAYTVSGTAYSFTDSTGLTKGTKYYYWLCAFNAVGESALLPGEAIPGPIPLALSVTATSGEASVELSWTDPNNDSNLENPVTDYLVIWSTSSNIPASLTASNSVSVAAGTTESSPSGLAEYTGYYFWVKARNAIGSSAAVPVQGIIGSVPAAPSGLSVAATTGTPGSLTLAWTPSSDGSVTGYLVVYAPSADGASFKTATAFTGAVSPSGTAISGLDQGVSYDVWVMAVNPVSAAASGAGFHWTSTPEEIPAKASAATGAVAGYVSSPLAASSPGTLGLSWAEPESGGAVILYRIFYLAHSGTAPASAPAYAIEKDVLSTVTSYQLSGLSQTVPWDVWIEADSAYGTIGQLLVTPAAGQYAVAPPNPVTNLAAVETGIPITLSWTGDATDIAYNVYASTSSVKPATPVASGLTASSYSLTAVHAATAYYFWVEGVNIQGLRSTAVSTLFTSFTPSGAPNVNGWYNLGALGGTTVSAASPETFSIDAGGIPASQVASVIFYTASIDLDEPTTATHFITGGTTPTAVNGDNIYSGTDGAFGVAPYAWAYLTDTSGNVLIYSGNLAVPAFDASAQATVSGIGDNGFTVSWPEASGAAAYIVAIGTLSAQASATPHVVTGATSYQATGLISHTDYSVWVSPVGTGVVNGSSVPGDGASGTPLSAAASTTGDLALSFSTTILPVMDQSTSGNLGWPSPPYSFTYNASNQVVSVSDNGTAVPFSGSTVDWVFDLGSAKTVSSMQWWWNAGPAAYEIDGTNDASWATYTALVSSPSGGNLNTTVTYAVNAAAALRYIRIHVGDLSPSNIAGGGNWGLSLNSVVITGH